MINPFARRIGIWYAHQDETMMNNIMDCISNWCEDCIARETRTKYNRTIYLKDGTVIIAIIMNENMRGQRLSDSYIIHPENTTQQFIDNVIKPITILGAAKAYELTSDKPEELWHEFAYGRVLRKENNNGN